MLCPGLGILKCPGLDILKYRVINLALTLRQSQSIKLILIETMRGADSRVLRTSFPSPNHRAVDPCQFMSTEQNLSNTLSDHYTNIPTA